MTTIALTSVRGAPGVTTTSLFLASVLGGAPVVEADLSGGVIAVRYQLGREPGLTTLAAANPRDPDGWREHAQDAGGVPVLVGPDAWESADSLWRTAGDRLTGVLGRIQPWVVVDAGRIHRRTPALRDADLVVVLVRPIAEQLIGLNHSIPSIRRDARGELAIALVGDGPYRSSDIEATFEQPIVAHLPHDPGAAGQLLDGRGGRSTLSRSRLSRTVTDLGSDLEALMAEREPVVAP